MNKIRALLFIAAWVAIWGMWKQHEKIGVNTKNTELLVELTGQVKINEDYRECVQALHQLDTKHTQELTWMMEQPPDLLAPLSEIIGYSESEL